MTNMPQKPFSCKTCGKGSYTVQCVKCMLPNDFAKTVVEAEDLEIKVSINKSPLEQHEERKKQQKIITDNNSKMFFQDALKIKLTNGKVPCNSWTKKENQSKTFKATKQNNVGIVCNETSNIFGIDLDFYTKEGKEPYDPINNPYHRSFISQFGENFIERFDTFTQKTPNGGIHLLFKHEEGLFQTQNDKYKIDTRGGSTNGYLVGAGSFVNGREYTIVNDTDIKPIPNNLRKFLHETLFIDENTSKSVGGSKGSKINKIVKSHAIPQDYSYNFTEEEIRNIIDRLPRNYFTDFTKWFIFTSAMKQINRKDLWEEYSKSFGQSQYNEKQNNFYWNKANNQREDCLYFENLMKNAHCLDLINLTKYKPLPPRISKPDQVINMPFLTGNKCENSYENGFDYDAHNNIIIQSDTGTAKSSSFMEYISKSGEKFISVVSRIWLARQQYEDFAEKVENVDFYKYNIDNLNKGLIICIDSIMKLKSWAYSNEIQKRVVFLDEFNSLIEYCLDTTTMDNKRIQVFDFLVNDIFMKAKKIICVDADISDISMKFINYIKEKRSGFTYIKNTHIHNKGTPATEIFSKADLVKTIQKEDTYFVACDSKNEAKDLYQQLIKVNPDKPIKLITAQDDKRAELDDYCDIEQEPRIIYSPKIIYGNDSNGFKGEFKRPVFCYYTGNTISPTAMFQQINRERKISHLYYCFENKEFTPLKFHNTKEVQKDIEEKQKEACEMIGRGHYSEEIEEMFINLYVDLIVKKDTYDTNKYVHFKLLLPQRGFVDTITEKKKTIKQNNQDKILKTMRINAFDKDNFNVADALNSDLNIDILKINNTNLIRKHKDLFIKSGKAENYLKQKLFYLSSEEHAENLLIGGNDIEFKKLDSKSAQVIYLRQVYKYLGYTPTLNKCPEQQEVSEHEILSGYKKYCRGTLKDIDFNGEQDKLAFLFKITKSILGDKFIDNKKRNRGGKRFVEYTFNNIKLNEVKEIADCKKVFEAPYPLTKDYNTYYRKWRQLD
jgi:hypothetical protein